MPVETRTINVDLIDDDPITDVRLGPADKSEEKSIEALALDIDQNGLIQPIKVRPTDGGRYKIVVGRRRLAATLYTGSKSIRAEIETLDDKEARRVAISENAKRKNFTPLQMALLYQLTAQENPEWSAAEIGEYFGVSKAQITEHLKLLEQPKSVQNDVHSGKLSFSAAQALWSNVAPEKKEKVAAKAAEIAKADKGSKGKAPSGKVERKHVEKAAKELEAEKVIKARGRADLLEPFELILEAADGYSAEIVAMAKYFVKTYATGGGTANGVVSKFNQIDEVLNDKKARDAKKAAKAAA